MTAQELINFVETFVAKSNFWYGELKGLKLYNILPENIRSQYAYINMIFDANARFILLKDKSENDYALLVGISINDKEIEIKDIITNKQESKKLFDLIAKKQRKKHIEHIEDTSEKELVEEDQEVSEAVLDADTQESGYSEYLF
jgi:mRNA-degrading endonuclease HigB of HigAB toxin-antitoxin module